jgi:hypothetical protein
MQALHVRSPGISRVAFHHLPMHCSSPCDMCALGVPIHLMLPWCAPAVP